MGSRSESGVGGRSRPSPELVAKLRQGKDELRRGREVLPLPEKIRQVIQLQRLQYPLLARQRTLRSWERPWEIEP
jgi:hypothetical protein